MYTVLRLSDFVYEVSSEYLVITRSESTHSQDKHWVSIADQLRVKWLVNPNPMSEMSTNHLPKVLSVIGIESVCLRLNAFSYSIFQAGSRI